MIYFKDNEINIRDIRRDDTSFLFSWWVDRSINRYDPRELPDDPKSLLKECNAYCSNLETEVFNPVSEKNVYKYFMITDTEDVPIGFINVFDYDSEKKDIELGIILGDKRYWHSGTGTKALSFVLSHLFNSMLLDTVHVETGETNLAALKLFKKSGFRKTGEYFEGDNFKYLVLTLEKNDWK